jgi:hypothetical protein
VRRNGCQPAQLQTPTDLLHELLKRFKRRHPTRRPGGKQSALQQRQELRDIVG